MSRAPQRQLGRRQRRKRKLRFLHRRLTEATNAQERQRLIAKIRRISSRSPIPER